MLSPFENAGTPLTIPMSPLQSAPAAVCSKRSCGPIPSLHSPLYITYDSIELQSQLNQSGAASTSHLSVPNVMLPTSARQEFPGTPAAPQPLRHGALVRPALTGCMQSFQSSSPMSRAAGMLHSVRASNIGPLSMAHRCPVPVSHRPLATPPC